MLYWPVDMWLQKSTLASIVRWPPMKPFMNLGIRFLVPKRRVGVALVALNAENQVLMLNHVFRPNAPWGLPGGWVGRNESPANAILREIREETGLTAQLGPVVNVANEPYNAFLTIFYLGLLPPDEMVLSSEILEAAWFDPDEVPEPIFPSSQEAIAKALFCHPHWMAEMNVGI